MNDSEHSTVHESKKAFTSFTSSESEWMMRVG